MQSKEKDTDFKKSVKLVDGNFVSLYQLNILCSLLYI